MLMKWINRIVYALIVAIGMMLVFNIVDGEVRSDVLREEGLKAIAEQRYEDLLAVRFHHTERLVDTTFSIGDADFELYLFDAAYIRDEAGRYVAYGGFTALIHQTAGTPLEEPFFLRFSSGTTEVALQMGFRILDLPVYSGADPETFGAFVPKEDVVYKVTTLIILQNEQELVSIPIDVEPTDLVVDELIQDYLDLHGTVPSEAFGQVGLTQTVAIDTSLYVVFYAALYLIVVAFTTYAFFVWKKKKMGRAAPTQGVLKDIQNISRD